MTRYADLHSHTTASDGSLMPTELVQRASEQGLALLAVTDHDTTAGCAEAAAAAQALGMGFVPGVELSTEGSPGKCHLLGLGIDPEHSGLRLMLAELSESRRTRNTRIVARFQEIGIPLTLDEVIAQAPAGANLGRPHFAQALIAKNVVSTVSEAFERYLAEGAAAYLPKAVLSPADAIQLIHKAGGLAVLAHPGLVRLRAGETMRERTHALRDLGLDAIEVYYSQHSAEQTAALLAVSHECGLLITGGSDFHGTSKPNVSLGVVVEGHGVPVDVLPPALRCCLPL